MCRRRPVLLASDCAPAPCMPVRMRVCRAAAPAAMCSARPQRRRRDAPPRAGGTGGRQPHTHCWLDVPVPPALLLLLLSALAVAADAMLSPLPLSLPLPPPLARPPPSSPRPPKGPCILVGSLEFRSVSYNLTVRLVDGTVLQVSWLVDGSGGWVGGCGSSSPEPAKGGEGGGGGLGRRAPSRPRIHCRPGRTSAWHMPQTRELHHTA